MDLEEIRKSKADLEETITLLCEQFCKRTGLRVRSIDPPGYIDATTFESDEVRRQYVRSGSARVTLEDVE